MKLQWAFVHACGIKCGLLKFFMKFHRNHLHLGQTFCTYCESNSYLSLLCIDLELVGLWNQEMLWGNINKVESLWKTIQYWPNETHQSSYILPKIYFSCEERNQDMTSWGRSFETQTHPFSNLGTAEVELASPLFSKWGGASSHCITAKLFASFSLLCVHFSFPITCQGTLAPTSCTTLCMICVQLVISLLGSSGNLKYIFMHTLSSTLYIRLCIESVAF